MNPFAVIGCVAFFILMIMYVIHCFCDDQEAWAKIDALGPRTKAMVEVMRDDLDDKQVEFAWRVEALNLEGFKSKLAALRVQTAAVFHDYGNSVS